MKLRYDSFKNDSPRERLLGTLGLTGLLASLNGCSAPAPADTMCVFNDEERVMNTCNPSDTTPDALEVLKQLNEYRQSQGLEPVPVSCELTHVAATHVRDLIRNLPHLQEECNLHSWSESEKWTGCCYTEDHARADCMLDKPRELSHYEANGYEIAAIGYKTPEMALKGWETSKKGHNDVILNLNDWKDVQWNAMGGAGLNQHWSVWFGKICD